LHSAPILRTYVKDCIWLSANNISYCNTICARLARLKLNLLQRFRENSDKVISKLCILISSFKDLINGDRELLKAIKNYYSKFEVKDGVNNWKTLLIKAMINSNVYFK